MKQKTGFVTITIFSMIFSLSTYAGNPLRTLDPALNCSLEKVSLFHNDSIHNLNFKYTDRKRGFKPYIAPTVLIASGTALHFSDAKYQFNDWVQENFRYEGSLDDYLRFAPLAAVYSLNAVGVKGKNNFGNLTAISIKSFVLNDLIVYSLKKAVNEERPSGGTHSFPSGHTSVVFAFAQIMHHEYGEQSVWYSVGAYSCAATVGVMRIAKGAHWASDVLAGAGIGMLSTELVYLTHQYKWDWAHIKQFDIFPFSVGPQKGLTVVYNF
ncbi:phosphatase PAP2 family protein [Maribellus sediminis]|uniref:phosphatase PAP2 family protein n=1 Tax=Maribellus sediminis TaxID=2696285 RepID=UPI001431165D|nr:phosphatase PAP2 family protein [Maribellus sediminis]